MAKLEQSAQKKTISSPSGAPTVVNGYDPIIGVPPTSTTSVFAIADTSLVESSTIAMTSCDPVAFVAISAQEPSTKPNGKNKAKKFHIVTNSLKMFSKNTAGVWVEITAGTMPFTVDNSIVGQPREEIKADEQFVINCPKNASYTGTFPAKLTIAFTLSDSDGSNSSTASYDVVRES